MNTVAETPTVVCLDRQMGHIMPQVVQEVERGCMTNVRLELTPFGYPVVDKSRADRFSPCEVPFECDLGVLMV